MFEAIIDKAYNVLTPKKVYQCECCGRLEAPYLFNQHIVRNYQWVDTEIGWICRDCYENPPQSEEEQMERIWNNRHHNLVIKNRVLRSEYGNKYKRIFAQ